MALRKQHNRRRQRPQIKHAKPPVNYYKRVGIGLLVGLMLAMLAWQGITGWLRSREGQWPGGENYAHQPVDPSLQLSVLAVIVAVLLYEAIRCLNRKNKSASDSNITGKQRRKRQQWKHLDRSRKLPWE